MINALPFSKVLRVFQAYAKGDEAWKHEFEWVQREYRSFRSLAFKVIIIAVIFVVVLAFVWRMLQA
jgi:hypothetical protein